MKKIFANFFALIVTVLFASNAAFAAAPNVLKAKQQADAKGYTFIANHDEIVAKAKKEGKVRIIAAMQPSDIRTYGAAFQKRYPFIEVDGIESTGADVAQRRLRELKSGAASEWDVLLVYAAFRSEYTPYLWKIDLLGMAEQGVFQVPPAIVDAKYGNVISPFTHFQVAALRGKKLSLTTWENHHSMEQWEAKIVEAYGFPKAK